MAFPYKCVLVTGATAGIGRALAERLIDNGAFVIAVGRRKERLDELLQKYGPEKVAVEEFDVGQVDKLEAWVSHLIERFPKLDAILLNAGTQYQAVLLAPKEVSLATITAESNTNYLSPLHTSILFLPHFQALSQTQPVAIITVTSSLAVVPILRAPTYCATKAAMHSYMWTLRATLAQDYPSLKVIEILPPAVQTELHTRQGVAQFGMPLQEFIDEAWEGLQSGQEEIPVGEAKARVAKVEDERRKAFAQLTAARPIPRPKE